MNNSDSILNYRSAILAVNVIGGMLEPAKIYLSQLCTVPTKTVPQSTNSAKSKLNAEIKKDL